MKITAVDVFPLAAELKEPFGFSQWTFRRRETTVVAVRTDEGLTGWGEAYGPSAPSAAALRDFFAPKVLGHDPRDTEALWHFLYARSLDYGQKGTMVAAISGLDIAFWDIKAQAAGVPLYRLLGGAEVEAIPCYATGFYFTEEDLERKFCAEAEQYLTDGFTAVKMKVGLGVERDASLVAAVRRAVGPKTRLMIDANHAYTVVEAVALGRRVEGHEIGWFEEPVSPLDLPGYLEVKRRLRIPIAGGEAEYTRFGFEPLLRRRAVDYAQPDLCACGGISEGWKIAAMASLYGVHVTPHAWGSAVGLAAALHFYAALPGPPASLRAPDKLLECDRTENPVRTEIVEEPIRFDQGKLFVPQGPGLGIAGARGGRMPLAFLISTVLITRPMPPPNWALAERAVLRASADAAREFAAKYTDPQGRFRCVERWGGNDGPDDVMETFHNWPLLYALGGDQSVLALYRRIWEAHLEQYTKARAPGIEMAERGMYYKEFITAFDWEHTGEGLQAFYHYGLASPDDAAFVQRSLRFAGFYLGPPNYDPQHRIIRSLHNGSRGPKLTPASELDWGGLPVEGDPERQSRYRTAANIRGDITTDDFVKQFEMAIQNIVEVVKKAGGKPENIMTFTIFTTRMAEYKASVRLLAEGYKRRMGDHYPAMALVEVQELVNPKAKVEIQGIAVLEG